MKLNLGRDSGFGQDFKFESSRDADVWLRFLSKCLIEIQKLKFESLIKICVELVI